MIITPNNAFIRTRRKTPAFRHWDIRRKVSTVGHTGGHAWGERVRPVMVMLDEPRIPRL